MKFQAKKDNDMNIILCEIDKKIRMGLTHRLFWNINQLLNLYVFHVGGFSWNFQQISVIICTSFGVNFKKKITCALPTDLF